MVVVLSLVLGAWTIHLRMQRSGLPESMTVDEALRRLERDDALPNVHLQDLAAHCDAAKAAGPRAYVLGFGSSDSKTRVIIPVEPNRDCEAFVATATDSARRARSTLVAKLVQRDALDAREPAFELHPHESTSWMLAMALVLLGVGSYGLRLGPRAPRRLALGRRRCGSFPSLGLSPLASHLAFAALGLQTTFLR